MEIKDHLRQKRIEIVNRVVSKIEEILKNGGEPNLPMILKEVKDFDEYVFRFWGMTWFQMKGEYAVFK